MATITAAGAGNWSDGATWTGGSKPGAEDTADLNGQAVVLNEDVTLVLIQATAGKLTTSGTRVINANITYSGTGTATNGMVQVASTLTINGKVTNTAAGDCICPANNNVTIANAGGTAIENTGGGRAMYTTGTGTHSITGAVVSSGGGYAIYKNGANSGTIDGNIYTNGGRGFWDNSGNGVLWVLNGCAYGNSVNPAIRIASTTTVRWVGVCTVPAGKICLVECSLGTLELATSSSALSVAVTGALVIEKFSGTVTVTAAGGTATATLQTAAAQVCDFGAGITVTGPTIPAVTTVKKDTTYGYAGDAKTGTLESTDPGVANVKTGTTYKIESVNKTGTASLYGWAGRVIGGGVG